MKYFTKTELEDITNSLLDNPSHETLKELNNKYNGVENVVEEAMPLPNINNMNPLEQAPIVENSMPSFEMPSEEMTNPEVQNDFQNIESIPNLETVQEPINMPNMEMPQAPIENPNIEEPPKMVVTPEISNITMGEVPNFGTTETTASIPNMEMPSKEPVTVSENMSIPSFEVPVEEINMPISNTFPNVAEPASNNIGISTLNIPNNNTSNIEITGPSIESGNQTIPTFQDINLNNNQVSNIQNNNVDQNSGVVPFDGNLWSPPAPDASSMMQPTENFNNNNISQNNQVPNQAPQYQQGPSMFGQLQNTFQ